MTTHISGGEVFYERRIKTGDFEHKHLSARLTFSVDEKDSYDKVFALAICEAVEVVHEALGLGGKPLSAEAQKLADNHPTDAQAARRGRPPKKRDAPPTTGDVIDSKVDPASFGEPASTTATPGADPAAMDGQVNGGKDRTVTEQVSAADPANVADTAWDAAAPEITDAVLFAEVTKKNAAIKNPHAIKKLIGQYGTQLVAIAKEKRQAFLDELLKL